MKTELQSLVGKKIRKIFLNDSFLKFETDQRPLTYGVEGDCCSHSYFFDFYGVKKLLENGPVTEVKEVELKQGDNNAKSDDDCVNDCIQCYGYQITTESKEFGPQTSVFSFRNSSNGYYGGSIFATNDQEVLPEITDDVSEVK